MPAGAPYLDSKGDLTLGINRLGAEADQRGAGSLEVLILQSQLLEAIVVEDFGRTARVDKGSLNQEVLQLQGEH